MKGKTAKPLKLYTHTHVHLENKKGITLIALVITIVVLIILALISINAVFGENGIIQSSHNARLVSEQGTILEDLRMEIYSKTSNLEYAELGGLQYLKTETGTETEKKVREDNTINVGQVREGIKSGRGSLDTGDVYYIEGTELFYLDKEKNTKNLGQIFNDTESLNPNLEIKKEVTSNPANGERYAVGEIVKYKITVTNIGTKTVKNIQIEDTLKAVDIVTKEETIRLPDGRTNGTFETLYDVAGNEIGNSLDVGKTGYINYSYTVVRDDVGKDLSNIAVVKGKIPIPKGEKPIVTPVELPTGTIVITKKVDYSNFEDPEDAEKVIGEEQIYYMNLQVWSDEEFTILLPDGSRKVAAQSYNLGLKDGESAIILCPNDIYGASVYESKNWSAQIGKYKYSWYSQDEEVDFSEQSKNAGTQIIIRNKLYAGWIPE